MFFAPFTCCSIGAAIDCDTTSALAPGKLVCTCTCGGTICGYCAMGSPKPASAPPSSTISEMTVEKIGRSMKKLNIARSPYCLVVAGCGADDAGVAAGSL